MSTPFGTFIPQSIPDSDEYKPIDHVFRALIVKVLEYKASIITPNSPEGGPGVIADVVDVPEAKVYRNVLWMSGSIVDNMKPHVGADPIVVHFEPTTSKSGRIYPGVVAATSAEMAAAHVYYNANPTVFSASLSTIAPPVTAADPVAAPVAAPPVAAAAPVAAPAPVVAAAPVRYSPEQLQAMLSAGMDISQFLNV